jgi:hypothetical protein
VHGVEQRRCTEQDEQPERQGDPQQRDRGHHECGDRGEPEGKGEVDDADPLGVGDRDGGQAAREPARLGAAARIEHPVGEPQPQPLVGAHIGQPGAARAVAVAQRQRREVQPQDDEPEDQRPRVARRHRLVDHHADQYRDQRLACLVPDQEQRRDSDVPTLIGDRTPEDRASRDLRVHPCIPAPSPIATGVRVRAVRPILARLGLAIKPVGLAR